MPDKKLTIEVDVTFSDDFELLLEKLMEFKEETNDEISLEDFIGD